MAMRIFLNGAAVEGTGGVQAVRSPFDGGVVGEVSQAGAGQVEAAIAGMVRAREAFARMAAYRRAEACALVSRRIGQRGEEFARLMALEAGKPLKAGRGEVQRAVSTFKLAAEEATRIGGEQLPVEIDARGEGYWAVVERFAIGPCSFITPFNFPLNLVAHKVAPAMACGCPFVVKPSERTPLTALLLGEILAECDLPEGSWSILPCDRESARALVSDERIKLLSFTGSPVVGFRMKAEAGKKAVVLELGNNSAVIVEPETDVADAAGRIVTGAFGYAGQSCISVQRILVHESIAVIETYSDFEEALGRVNASRFGLQAGLFSRDLHKVRRAFEMLEVGGLVVNDVPTTRIDNMPYGGVKDSGIGREGVKYAIEHMTERRVLLVRRASADSVSK